MQPDCDEAFAKHHQLRSHLCTAHAPPGTKPYQCSHEGCTKSFSTNQHLRTHLRVHNGKRQFSYLCIAFFINLTQISDIHACKLHVSPHPTAPQFSIRHGLLCNTTSVLPTRLRVHIPRVTAEVLHHRRGSVPTKSFINSETRRHS